MTDSGNTTLYDDVNKEIVLNGNRHIGSMLTWLIQHHPRVLMGQRASAVSVFASCIAPSTEFFA